MREKGGNRLVLGSNYMVDELKLPNQAPRVSDEPLQTCVAWYEARKKSTFILKLNSMLFLEGTDSAIVKSAALYETAVPRFETEEAETFNFALRYFLKLYS
ncbi:hypothetical protein TNCV_4049171 [Trichonephila clavipes]|nr:hypothetical protein TNCV_4049171 [Trichonephila clavipes]